MALAKASSFVTNDAVARVAKNLLPHEPFGQGANVEWLREIYQHLHAVYGPSPKRRVRKVATDSPWNDLRLISSNFEIWCQDPNLFWERPLTTFTSYIRYIHESQPRRARLFLQSAVQLSTKIEELRVLQRFVAVSAYELFQRIVPHVNKRISANQITQFLTAIHLHPSPENLDKYGGLVRRGHDWVLFCRQLDALESPHIQSLPPTPNVGATDDRSGSSPPSRPGIYGPLFVTGVDDSIFGSNGLFGSDKEQYIKQLSKSGLSKAARGLGANQAAHILLMYHQNLLWLPPETLPSSLLGKRKSTDLYDGTQTSQKRPRNNPHDMISPPACNPASPDQLAERQPDLQLVPLTPMHDVHALTSMTYPASVPNLSPSSTLGYHDLFLIDWNELRSSIE